MVASSGGWSPILSFSSSRDSSPSSRAVKATANCQSRKQQQQQQARRFVHSPCLLATAAVAVADTLWMIVHHQLPFEDTFSKMSPGFQVLMLFLQHIDSKNIQC